MIQQRSNALRVHIRMTHKCACWNLGHSHLQRLWLLPACLRRLGQKLLLPLLKLLSSPGPRHNSVPLPPPSRQAEFDCAVWIDSGSRGSGAASVVGSSGTAVHCASTSIAADRHDAADSAAARRAGLLRRAWFARARYRGVCTPCAADVGWLSANAPYVAEADVGRVRYERLHSLERTFLWPHRRAWHGGERKSRMLRAIGNSRACRWPLAMEGVDAAE